MNQENSIFSSKLTAYLPWLEKIFLTAIIVGSVLKHLDQNSIIIIQSSLIGLGITYFMSAFKPKEIQFSENDRAGMSEFFGLLVIPNILWISSAISILALAFLTMNLQNDGYKNMAAIGGMAISIALLILFVTLINGTKHLRSSIPVVKRALAAFAIDYYLFFNT